MVMFFKNTHAAEDEIPLKRWVMTMAEREGVKPTAIYNRLNRGTLKPALRRVNKHVIFVVCQATDRLKT